MRTTVITLVTCHTHPVNPWGSFTDNDNTLMLMPSPLGFQLRMYNNWQTFGSLSSCSSSKRKPIHCKLQLML